MFLICCLRIYWTTLFSTKTISLLWTLLLPLYLFESFLLPRRWSQSRTLFTTINEQIITGFYIAALAARSWVLDRAFFPYWESNRGVGLRTRPIERKGKSSTIIWKCLNRSNSSFKSKGSVIWCRLWKSIRGRGERWCLSVLWMRMARAGAPIVETVCNSSGIFRPGNYQQA